MRAAVLESESSSDSTGVPDGSWAIGKETGEKSVGRRVLVLNCLSKQSSRLEPHVFGDTNGVVKGWANPAIGTSTSTIHSDDCTLFYKTLGVKLSHVMYIPSGDNPADPLSRGIYPPTSSLLPNTLIPTDAQPFLQDTIITNGRACEPFSPTSCSTIVEPRCGHTSPKCCIVAEQL
jgi:hypothetical protein